MRTRQYTSLGMSMMLVATFSAVAEEAYTPAEYKPTVEYLAPEKISAPAAASEPLVTAQQPPEPKPETSESSTAPSAEENSLDSTPLPPQGAELQSREPNSSGNNILYLAVLAVAGGAMLFRKKTPSGNVTPVSAYNPSATTGVERYIEKLTSQKTGVAKYLERQSDTLPTTGVAKYLAKQVIKDRSQK